MSNTGYKKMLRDRCPKVVNYGLKWCKAKEKWLNHVYENFIWIYSSKKERLNATKNVLGIDKKYLNFDFHKTIDWENLSPEELYDWTYIENWVVFFQKKYAYIEQTYVTSLAKGENIRVIKYTIMKNWLIDLCPSTNDSDEEKERKTKYINSLVDYLIDCFEGRIQ